jgi:type VI secretion system secreted protein VgrG
MQKIDEKAMNITSEASAKNMTKGAMVNVEASGVNTIKGSLVKIN